MTTEGERNLNRTTMMGMVVGSMVGAGIFSLPATFGNATGPFGALIAWLIAGTGMLMLAFVFQFLAVRKPELDAGIFTYAKEGFGNYLGFIAAFGFWAGSCLGNTTYFVLIKSTLGAAVPAFGEGNTIPAVIVSSIILWSIHFMILRGVKQAAAINKVVTVAKIVPIIIFIIILVFAFKKDLFSANFWGGGDYKLADVMSQVRRTMLVTVFVFIGVEGASVFSRYAKNRADVGWATVMGFLGVLCLMVLVTLLPYGAMLRPEIADLRQPSMAGVLQHVVGNWGAIFISAGLIVSVLGAYLAWTLLCAEALFTASKYDLVPKVFGRENKNGVPHIALWLTNSLVQIFLIMTIFAQYAFDLTLEMTSAMTLIPYLLVAAYGFKLAYTRETYAADPARLRNRELGFALTATLYAIFMIMAGGLEYVLLACILFAPGTLLFIFARRELKLSTFSKSELMLFIAILVGAIIGIYALATGAITL
ncbi:arginine:ornithine antiporter, APA family [Microbulbifer donghaiensis]|uniref:Arginine:ornithine antiporter, APA family n=1 Tax=Microbulbifer donghaiensis TaxID=494016 RepID=A0A1M5G4K5_9GAMM|nr:basic amino acid/polyamine antiporter [Microbulbifer donghaiensis]SHF98648.1 arginine:ornithine antiporter, APA family [Microbulbifer donghaiensis]